MTLKLVEQMTQLLSDYRSERDNLGMRLIGSTTLHRHLTYAEVEQAYAIKLFEIVKDSFPE